MVRILGFKMTEQDVIGCIEQVKKILDHSGALYVADLESELWVMDFVNRHLFVNHDPDVYDGPAQAAFAKVSELALRILEAGVEAGYLDKVTDPSNDDIYILSME